MSRKDILRGFEENIPFTIVNFKTNKVYKFKDYILEICDTNDDTVVRVDLLKEEKTWKQLFAIEHGKDYFFFN